MTQPAVSVVLITYNHAAYIRQSIESVRDGFPDDGELIVVDDGSTDDTLAQARSAAGEGAHIISKPNGGPSSALNAGMRAAKGQYVAIISGDDVSMPGGINKRLAFIRDSGADIAYSVPALIDSNGAPVEDEAVRAIFMPLPDPNPIAAARHLLFRGNFVCAPSVIMHRTVFETVGLHAEALYQSQDYELWIRASLAGFRIATSLEPFVKYRIHTGNLSGPANRARTYWELTAILRRTAATLTRAQIDQLSAIHAPDDPDIVARALLFSQVADTPWRTVSQELLEIAMLDNTALKILETKYALGLPELRARAASLEPPPPVENPGVRAALKQLHASLAHRIGRVKEP